MTQKKEKKSHALEVSLVILAIIVAFIVQHLIKSPELPADINVNKTAVDSGDKSTTENTTTDEVAIDQIPAHYQDNLSDLASYPDWKKLDPYQYTVERGVFLAELESVYTLNGDWKKWIDINDDHAVIRTHRHDHLLQLGDQISALLQGILPLPYLPSTAIVANPTIPPAPYKLYFAGDNPKEDTINDPLPTYWRKKDQIKLSDSRLPLQGVHIVIDPGHIGGSTASIEERQFKYKEQAPVQEGNLTLTVAHKLETQLKALGAKVDLTRNANEPVNSKKSEDYKKYAKSRIIKTKGILTEQTVQKRSERLFYRAGEIQARANIINNEFRPDIVICLHFNATGSSQELLIEHEHTHMILNGAYTTGEVALDDQRFAMLQKILQRNHPEETAISSYVANALAFHTGLPPFKYEPNSRRAINIDDNPYLWARNLAANRTYECPVIYCEPYLFNGSDSHTRIIKGDYEGLQYVNGKLRPSIFREYVNAVTEGLVTYYRQRPISK